MSKHISLPVSDEVIHSLSIGDPVLLSGRIITGRDAVHKWLFDTFVRKTRQPAPEEQAIYEALVPILDHSLIYHCGPVVAGLETQHYRFTAAGPTTSIREEPYQAEIMRLFNLKGVIGKGGMGAETLSACRALPAVYFHAIGGAAAVTAECIPTVKGVYKLDFGVPEAIWIIEIKDFPAVVTMDAHGNSLHDSLRESSKQKLNQLINH